MYRIYAPYPDVVQPHTRFWPSLVNAVKNNFETNKNPQLFFQWHAALWFQSLQTLMAVVFQAFLTKGSLGEVQAGQVISFGAVLLVTEHQLPSVTAAKALVLRFLSFTFSLFILSLQPLPFWLSCLAVWVLQRRQQVGINMINAVLILYNHFLCLDMLCFFTRGNWTLDLY